jgi:NitT/TauT family transport system permease protein
MRFIKKIICAVVGIGTLIVIWQLATYFGRVSSALFPPPMAALTGLYELATTGVLWESIAVSMLRFFAGYLSAAVLAVVLGMCFGYFKGLWQFINPAIQILRPISPIAWLPFVVLWFGIGDIPAIAIVFIAAFFPILLNTVSAVAKVDPMYFKLAKNFGLSRLDVFAKIIFPAAFPNIASGLHIAIGTAWVFIVAGEMVGAQSGLGFLIADTRNNVRIDLLMAAMFAIGLSGLALDEIVVLMERQIYKKWGAISE